MNNPYFRIRYNYLLNFMMDEFDKEQSFRTFSETISNKSYFELLERYILLDKTSDLDKKHKEWSNTLMEN